MPIQITDTLVGLLPVGTIPESLKLSEDNNHFTCVVVEAGRMRVAYDGNMGPLYDGITRDTPILSPDGRRCIYAAQKGGKEFVVIEGSEGPQFDAIVEDRLCFSPDSQRLAYVGFRDKKMVLVVDGEASEDYDWIFRGPSFFSPDSRRVCFVGQREGKTFLVVDGEIQRDALYDTSKGIRADTPLFSPDSQHIAYVAQFGDQLQSRTPRNTPQGLSVVSGGQQAVVRDGVLHPTYDHISTTPLFSPDGSRIGYTCVRAGRAYANIDGLEQGPYEGIGEDAPVFSPDGRRVAYSIRTQGRSSVVVDGVQSDLYPDISAGTPIFSSNGQRLAYVVKRGNKAALVLDGQEQPAKYQAIQKHALAFSPDSQRIAFAARTGLLGLKGCAEVDGQQGPTYTGLGLAPPIFSPDSQRVAYMALSGLNKAFVVVDGVEGIPCNKFADGSLRFSPDCTFVVYLAQLNGQAVVIVDGLRGEKGAVISPATGTIIRGSDIVFDSPNKFHILTLSSNREIKRLEVSVAT